MNALETVLPTRPTQTAASSESGQDVALLRLGSALKDRGYRYTAVTPATHTLVNNRTGNEWAQRVEDVLGWSRPFHADVLPAALVALMREAGILREHGDGWRCRLRASTLNDSLFFHSAYPTNDTDAVFFGPDTYRFVGAIDQYLAARAEPVRRVADIGCGAGPGAIAVALRHPHAEVLAIDINDQAVRLARINAKLAGTDNVHPMHSNLLARST